MPLSDNGHQLLEQVVDQHAQLEAGGPAADDDHQHDWRGAHHQGGLVRCVTDGCELAGQRLSLAQAELADHWAACPLPPDAGCTTCREYARHFLWGAQR